MITPDPRLTPWLSLLARLVVGVVWIWAGAAKLTDPIGSVRAVQAYELLPTSVEEALGYALPAVEVVVGVALVLGVLTRGAAVISAVLFVAFIIGIASVWARGMEIDCGCFGGGGYDPDASSTYPVDLARDVALLLASLWVVRFGAGRLALDHLLFRRRPTPVLDEDDHDPDPDRVHDHDHDHDHDARRTDVRGV